MHVIVVGGGIGGLVTAALLARGGAAVTVLERSAHLGGRARTLTMEGLQLNLGPHALYRAGAAYPVLAKLGLPLAGALPPSSGWLKQGPSLYPLPGGLGSFLTSPALSWSGRLALPSALLARPAGTTGDWLATLPPDAAALIRALLRVSSYAHPVDPLPATFMMNQLRTALRGVLYLDGGWQSIVDGLAAAARAAGATIETSVDVVAAETGRVRLADGQRREADAVVLALPLPTLRRFGIEVPAVRPVRAACLDLGLQRLPSPEHRFVLGLDRPLYLSEHGGVAKLGGTVLHVARYLAPEEDGADAEAELESLLDQVQPGWRDVVLARRFAPALVVSFLQPGERLSLTAPPGVHLVTEGQSDALLLDAIVDVAAQVASRLLAK